MFGTIDVRRREAHTGTRAEGDGRKNKLIRPEKPSKTNEKGEGRVSCGKNRGENILGTAVGGIYSSDYRGD